LVDLGREQLGAEDEYKRVRGRQADANSLLAQ
jgi:hypothetical protein